MRSSTPTVVVVLATYNERENVERLLPDLLTMSLLVDVVIVDDASPDGTGDFVANLAGQHPGRVVLIRRSGKLGYGSAFVAGFKAALDRKRDVIVSMDADYSHDPRSIAALVDGLADTDVAIGSRYVDGIRILNWSMGRLLLSAGANRYINLLLRYGIDDCTSGFRAYRARVLASVDLDRAGARGYAFLVELLEAVHRAEFRVREVPITYTERQKGRSKMSRGVISEALVRPWVLLLKRLLPGQRTSPPRTSRR